MRVPRSPRCRNQGRWRHLPGGPGRSRSSLRCGPGVGSASNFCYTHTGTFLVLPSLPGSLRGGGWNADCCHPYHCLRAFHGAHRLDVGPCGVGLRPGVVCCERLHQAGIVQALRQSRGNGARFDAEVRAPGGSMRQPRRARNRRVDRHAQGRKGRARVFGAKRRRAPRDRRVH